MDAPTPDEVRSRSALVAQRFPDPAGDPDLAQRIEVLAPVIADLTGRAFGVIPGEAVPDYLEPVAQAAFAMKIEKEAVSARDRRKQIASLNLRSVNAGPWGESYFGPAEAAKMMRLDPDAALHELLWTLATEAKRTYWLLLWGEAVPPAAGVQTFPWPRRSRRSPRRV